MNNVTLPALRKFMKGFTVIKKIKDNNKKASGHTLVSLLPIRIWTVFSGTRWMSYLFNQKHLNKYENLTAFELHFFKNSNNADSSKVSILKYIF